MADESPVLDLRVVLTVEDFDKALAFYRDALGLPLTRAWESAEGKGAVLAAGKATVELLSPGQADEVDRAEIGRALRAPVRIALEVADSAATAKRLEAAGAEKLGDVVTTPWRHRNVRLQTPEGVQLTLFTDLDK